MAIFFGDLPAEKKQIYNDVKRAYGYRSKVVHGDTLKPSKLSDLSACAKACDGLVRRALWKAMSDSEARIAFQDTNVTLDQYFLSLLFGDLRTGSQG